MIYSKEIKEALAIMNRMLDALMQGLSVKGEDGSAFRTAVGDLRAEAPDLIEDFTIGDHLDDCFEQARLAGANLASMDRVRVAMLAEDPTYDFGIAVQMTGLVFSLVQQCKMIAAMTFVSRFDVEDMMTKMTAVVEDIKLEISDLLDGVCYRQTVELAAALIQHLAATERQLPRIVAYTSPDVLPSLVLANFFYADGGRSNEIADENKVVHPLFCPRQIRVLSE